jgi:putative transposase
LPQKIKYIEGQEEHHRKTSFLEEYLKFLEEYEIPYDERYVFKPVE